MTRATYLGLAAALALPACTKTPRLAPRPSLLEAATMVGAYESPARWRYHPRRAARQLTRLKVNEATLYAGYRGERWLVSDQPRAAAQLAPEPLIAVSQTSTGWIFVGQSGTAYESEQPLGPFVRSSSPYLPLTEVSGAGSTILGLQRDGRLVRSGDAGESWEYVGPKGHRFVGVAFRDDGKGLALQVPEQLWVTQDGGANWNPFTGSTIGAIDVQRVAKGWILVKSVLGDYRWYPERDPQLRLLTRAPSGLDLRLKKKPSRGPDAGALVEGRAVVVGNDYYEIAPVEGARREYRLVSGSMHGKLKARRVKEVSGCPSVRLAGFGKVLELACIEGADSETSTKIRFLRSKDSGTKWKEETFSARGRLAAFKMALGQEGALLVTGVCLASSTRRGCRPQGIHHRRLADLDDEKKDAKETKKQRQSKTKNKDAGPIMELAPSAVPALRGVGRALTFSPDGRTAYAVGPRTKGGGYAVYVSNDHGRTFQARELPQFQAAGDANQDYGQPPTELEGYDVVSLSAAEDGTLALIVRRWNEILLVAVDEDGRLLSSAAPPEGTALVGAVGMRALAIAGVEGTAWETLDGGASWTPVGQVPVNVCQPGANCTVPIHCHVSGCVIADELSRIGWRGQADDEGSVILPPEVPPHHFMDRRVRTPIECILGDDDWQPMAHVDGHPNAHRAAMGNTVWFTLAQDQAKAAGGVWVAKPGAAQKVEYQQLLAPVGQPSDYAFRVSSQIEGVATLRYRVATSASSEMKDVEVAWANFMGGQIVRTKLGRTLPYNTGDYQSAGIHAQLAQPALLSIAAGGIYLRPHAYLGDDQTTYFLDGQRVVELPGVTWPTASQGRGRTEMAHVDGQHVPILIWQNGVALVRGRMTDDGWKFDARAIGLVDPSKARMSQTWDIAYDPVHSGLWIKRNDEVEVDHSAFYRFRAEGAVTDDPIAVPTQSDLGEVPTACTEAQRANTPRIVAPFHGGTRHPVIVAHSREPLRILLTNDAVLHGTPEAPCAAAFDATLVVSDSYGQRVHESALILAADMEHSWLFRTVHDEGTPRVEYRTMECKMDPGAEVPEEIYNQPGTLVRW